MAPAKQERAHPRTTHSTQRRKKPIEQSRFKTARNIRHKLRFINMNLPNLQKKSRVTSICPNMPR